MLTLKRRKKERLRAEPVRRREFRQHRRWVRSFECCVATLWIQPFDQCRGAVVFAHARLGAHAGMSQKPEDWHGVPLCVGHHKEEHEGSASFERKYGVDLQEIAAELAKRSPDLKMRAAMREAA